MLLFSFIPFRFISTNRRAECSFRSFHWKISRLRNGRISSELIDISVYLPYDKVDALDFKARGKFKSKTNRRIHVFNCLTS